MSPTRAPRSRSSRRWAPSRRPSAHLPLLADATGAGLSKRLGSLSLADLRADGIEPLAIASYLATVGAGAPELRTSLAALAADFDLAQFGGGSPRFDPAELAHLNARLLRQLSFAEVADRLPPGTSERLWLAVRGNIQRLGRCRDLARGSARAGGAGDRMPRIRRRGRAPAARGALGRGDLGQLDRRREAGDGPQGRGLFHPLRLALTARGDGPELKILLPLIGRARALARLQGATG